MIGSFGDVIFETSDKRILTYTGFRRDGSSRFADHEVIGRKPISEWIGPGNDNISFEIKLIRSLGVNPEKMIALFTKYNREGLVFPLVVGLRTVGVDKWRMGSLGESENFYGPNGEIMSATLEITLVEYEEHL